eukprot:CAMPEP_0175299806 /NCGR_PEP_ID=MMETSP0093-20121207/60791_1 /TAXON_ID=311494 /ORGANISM="Alexandrium monilatum, Strain CCMP3105" /LENGTH=44 /DNA_ID= /DNA_START= /DNA_END= /DNA_ORIENTATION=
MQLPACAALALRFLEGGGDPQEWNWSSLNSSLRLCHAREVHTMV